MGHAGNINKKKSIPPSPTQVTCYITQRVKWPHSQDIQTCTKKRSWRTTTTNTRTGKTRNTGAPQYVNSSYDFELPNSI